MRNYLTFGGIDSRDYGVYISGTGVFNVPEKSYQYIEVPGRNGDLIGNLKRMNNIDVVYPAFIYSNFKENVRDFFSALMAVNGYARLQDSYYPSEFRLASFNGDVSVSPERLRAGEFDLSFYCKPQRWLTSGEAVQTFATAGTVTNPTTFESRPLVRVNGYGTVNIGSNVITVVDVYPYIDIDCEIMDCFYGSANANDQVTFASNNFPTLVSGANAVSFSGNITSVEITPRWFRV